MLKTICCSILFSFFLFPFSFLLAQDEPLLAVDEGKIYRKLNADTITGKDVLDLVVEETWEQGLQLFITHILCEDEARDKKIALTEEDVDAELQHLLNKYAERMNIPPGEAKLETIAQRLGGLAHLRQTSRDSLSVLRVLQQEGRLGAAAHINDRMFEEALRERLEKRMAEKAVITDPKRLGTGEALRLGGRSFARDQVREFMLEALRLMPLGEFKQKIEVLTRDKWAARMLAEKKLELTHDDLEFHFSYLCRQRNMENGRFLIGQDLKKIGMTPEQFLASRLFKSDAALTLLAKQGLNLQRLRDEFAAHPERYKRAENMIAHIFICVLDPEGRPYTANWKAPEHEAVNQFVARRRDAQFAAAEPKIAGLRPPALEDFAAAAQKFSEDPKTSPVGGTIGRIGPETILMPPCDPAVREAALKLKPGEVSAPVRSDFGWHLLKCLEKQDVTFDESAERVYLNLISESRISLNKELENTPKTDSSQ